MEVCCHQRTGAGRMEVYCHTDPQNRYWKDGDVLSHRPIEQQLEGWRCVVTQTHGTSAGAEIGF